MKVSAFGLSADKFRVDVTSNKDGSLAVNVVNDETDIVLHFENADDAHAFGDRIAEAVGMAVARGELPVKTYRVGPPTTKDQTGLNVEPTDQVKAVAVDDTAGALVPGQVYTVKHVVGTSLVLAEKPGEFWHAKRFALQLPF